MSADISPQIAPPDIVLRDAYLKVCNRLGIVGRDKFVASDTGAADVRMELGPRYAHLTDRYIKERVLACCKNPAGHGGGWATGKRSRKPAKAATEAQRQYAAYLESERWDSIRRQALERDGRRCRICNSQQSLEVHHRSYQHLGNGPTEAELADVTTLCGPCHGTFHKHGRGLK